MIQNKNRQSYLAVFNHLKTILYLESNDIVFIILMWLFSRLLIIVAMQLIAPSLALSPVKDDFIPTTSWQLFSLWDGEWYERIATEGYRFAPDGKAYSLAFFPVYPLLTRAVMMLGLPFAVAGSLVNNLAFLGALYFLYQWAKERYDTYVAKWAVAAMAWCPYSLFATVNYTEGLFLLSTTAALRAFDRENYTGVTIWGIIATATRIPGIFLVPAFLWVAWKEKRGARAYFASVVTPLGLLLFSLYCALNFRNLLAFKMAQQGWTPYHRNWSEEFQYILNFDLSSCNAFDPSTCHSIVRLIVFLGSICLLWQLRNQLSRIAFTYGLVSLGFYLFTPTLSITRFVYGITPVSLALGLILARYPIVGYLTMGLFGILLSGFSIGWAWHYWIA